MNQHASARANIEWALEALQNVRARFDVHVEAENGDYGPAEVAHLVVNRMVSELLRLRLGTASDMIRFHG